MRQRLPCGRFYLRSIVGTNTCEREGDEVGLSRERNQAVMRAQPWLLSTVQGALGPERSY